MTPKEQVEDEVTMKLKIKDKNKSGYQVVDPIGDFNLGEQAFKIEKSPMEDTEPSFKGLGLTYYTVRGGEVVSKGFNKDRDAVIFNKGEANEFKIPLEQKSGHTLTIDRWYSDRSEAIAFCKMLTETEQEKASELMQQWQKANSMYEDQLTNSKF